MSPPPRPPPGVLTQRRTSSSRCAVKRVEHITCSLSLFFPWATRRLGYDGGTSWLRRAGRPAMGSAAPTSFESLLVLLVANIYAPLPRPLVLAEGLHNCLCPTEWARRRGAAAAQGTRCRTSTLRERALGGAHVGHNNVQRYYIITLLLSALPVSTMSAPGTPDPAATLGYTSGITTCTCNKS
eukprot:COSAG02_NODE_4316_length_5512_cov_72.504188_5_plen_183_part_00